MAEGVVRAVVTWASPPEHPAGVGLQDKTGELVEGVGSEDGARRYTVDITVRERRGSGGGEADFGGPFVFGTAGDRFLYLSFQGTGGSLVRRSKIALPRDWALPVGDEIHVTVIDADGSRAVLGGTGWSAAAPEKGRP
ncbi:hypothetical protein SAMN05216188_12929 [Lentzea xinjiangensis]|uniref:Uncharacterized protein n=1 Tax=Lentzea xinjiangensis TaxID=402600 RepID=A0A1H9VZ25_9PSEU|nr:DUF5990 family protein [Lentzea xinjiangensis]SES26902.1 hypothetical protein SAMN05216188_12929 [Lentzea xinjiangensis]